MFWTACFDGTYISRYWQIVYGTHAPVTMNWSDVRIMYPKFLTSLHRNESVKQCFSKYRNQVYIRPFYDAMWVNYAHAANTSYTSYPLHINRGGDRVDDMRERTSCHVRQKGWTEVIHQPMFSSREWGSQLWMYRATGSGLWYNMGKTLVCNDTIDLYQHLRGKNTSIRYYHRNGPIKVKLFEHAIHILKNEFDSIEFWSHIDGMVWHRMVMHEIVSTTSSRNHIVNATCPITSLFRRGYPPFLEECSCKGYMTLSNVC
jgi:hypothetical protein